MGKRVNTTVKERKALLKELGYTEEEMKKFYEIEKWVGKSIADQFEKVGEAEAKEKETEDEKDATDVEKEATEVEKGTGNEITADTIDKIVDYMADHCIGCNIYYLTTSEIREMREYLKEHISDIK